MNVLLIYPETPSTFWSFKDALKFVSKKAAEPPLGLITVAAMLPREWNKKLTDMNTSALEESDIQWADFVFLGGMNIHAHSIKDIIRQCNILGKKIVAGGPLFTTQSEDFLGIDHFVLNEAELTLPLFLNDLEKGNPKTVYYSEEFPDITNTPMPLFELLDIEKYASLSIQYSRGCPFDCEFCSITMLNGRKPRTKTTKQFIAEIERLYEIGWRGDISIVDDNFIGNRKKLKDEILPEIIRWQKIHKYPFKFITEVSINLSEDDELIALMVEAGITSIFIGIETPNNDSLTECGKFQNQKNDLVASVRKLQQSGMIVSGGFIVGFDNDSPAIFDQQINFIQQSGIVSAMVGLLNAPRGTKLYKRLEKEHRLLDGWSGNNMDGATNFIPKMKYNELIKGYSRIISTIYSPREYYKRLRLFIKEYNNPEWLTPRVSWKEFKAFIKLVWLIGIIEKGKKEFWNFLLFSIRYPEKFPLAMTLTVYGYHFRRIASTI